MRVSRLHVAGQYTYVGMGCASAGCGATYTRVCEANAAIDNMHPCLTADDELCAAFDVPKRMLPAIKPSSHVYGACLPSSPIPGVVVAGALRDLAPHAV